MGLNTDSEFKKKVTQFLKALTMKFSDEGIQKLEHRMQKRLDKNGDCVESSVKLTLRDL